MVDDRVQKRFENYQIYYSQIDLLVARHTSHALFSYNLHLVFVNEARWGEIRDDSVCRIRDMIETASRSKGHLLRRGGLKSKSGHAVRCEIARSFDTPEPTARSYQSRL
jgi:hypothetical protein